MAGDGMPPSLEGALPRPNFDLALLSQGKQGSIFTNSPEMVLGTDVLKSRSTLEPGIYASKPYSMIVAAPRDIDPQMAARGNGGAEPMPTISPEIHFEKIAPAPRLFAERAGSP